MIGFAFQCGLDDFRLHLNDEESLLPPHPLEIGERRVENLSYRIDAFDQLGKCEDTSSKKS
jgi:hypothetical protein